MKDSAFEELRAARERKEQSGAAAAARRGQRGDEEEEDEQGQAAEATGREGASARLSRRLARRCPVLLPRASCTLRDEREYGGCCECGATAE